jgi:hypothetical protein
MEERVARLEGINEQIRDRLNSIERTIDIRFGELAGQMSSRFAQVDARFRWLTGVAIISRAGPAASDR